MFVYYFCSLSIRSRIAFVMYPFNVSPAASAAACIVSLFVSVSLCRINDPGNNPGAVKRKKPNDKLSQYNYTSKKTHKTNKFLLSLFL